MRDTDMDSFQEFYAFLTFRKIRYLMYLAVSSIREAATHVVAGLRPGAQGSEKAHDKFFTEMMPEVSQYTEMLIRKAKDKFSKAGWGEGLTIMKKPKAEKFDFKGMGTTLQPMGDFVTFKKQREFKAKKNQPKKRKPTLQ